jgi:hypothetical protein
MASLSVKVIRGPCAAGNVLSSACCGTGATGSISFVVFTSTEDWGIAAESGAIDCADKTQPGKSNGNKTARHLTPLPIAIHAPNESAANTTLS